MIGVAVKLLLCTLIYNVNGYNWRYLGEYTSPTVYKVNTP